MVIIKYEKQSIIIVPLFNELIPGAEPLHPLLDSSLAAAAAMRRCFSSRSRYDETAEAREGGGQAGLCRREGSTRRPKGPPGMGWRGASWRRAAGSEPSVRSVRGGISV